MNNEIKKSGIGYLESVDFRLAVQRNSLAVSMTDASATSDAPHVIFCGGFHSNMQGSKAQALAQFCTDNNWPFTRFDYRGHGDSDGEPHKFTLHDWLEDTLQVLDTSDHPALVIGSSMGAWLAMLAALRRPAQVKGLLLLAAAPDFLQELVEPALTPSQIWDLQQDQIVPLANEYDSAFPLTKALLASGQDLSVLTGAAMETLACPVRLLHGTGDINVPYSLSIRLMDRIAHDQAQLTLLHKADHRLSDGPSLDRIQSELAELIEAISH